ncbi:secretion system chaperone SscA [Paraburkholderia graminis]|uniref:Secretion system chaperone SscA n=2 Tax=Paraburkholderia graminis TaxID=60548 RepID=A0ABD5C7V0_9BURK|nr:secretion system chaperone SscA [Paraburkholderia graminis]
MTPPNENGRAQAVQLVQELLSMGASLSGLQGVDQNDLDQVYSYGYALFNRDDFDGARRVFYTLARIDHGSFAYWMALGLTLQRLGEHNEALFCFSRSAAIHLSDPRSSYLAGVSYLILGNEVYAKKAFSASVKWCGKRPEHQALRERAQRSLAGCDKGEVN